jgi:hypothetical protein
VTQDPGRLMDAAANDSTPAAELHQAPDLVLLAAIEAVHRNASRAPSRSLRALRGVSPIESIIKVKEGSGGQPKEF